jgi:hypothetical protein
MQPFLPPPPAGDKPAQWLEFAVISAEKACMGRGNLRIKGALALAAVLAGLAGISPAQAQFGGTATGPAIQQFAPSGTMPQISAPTPVAPRIPMPQASAQAGGGQGSLSVIARFGRDNPMPIANGLLWRIYSARPEPGKAPKPLKEDKNPAPVFGLSNGDYVVNVTLGLASLTKLVSVRNDAVREVFDLPAGGIRIEGRVADTKIPAGQISFDVYQGSQFEQADKQPIAHNVLTGEVVVVPEGSYSIVSNYGDTNAVVRSDIRVQAGKLTDVTVSHRAAVIMLKLVTASGGEALANTEWSVLTPGGDVIKESIGAFPKMVLAEGEYRAIARNEGRTYERSFRVTTGVDGEIEVLAR